MAVKPQLACFERLGAPGWAALAEVCAAAQRAGPAGGRRRQARRRPGHRDGLRPGAGRGDRDALGRRSRGLGADAFTANPLLGDDALEPLVDAAAGAGAGVFALVRTSNPGAADLQDAQLGERPLHEQLAALVDGERLRLAGELGALAGWAPSSAPPSPQHIGRLRELMPRSIFLIPGVGAQGGQPEQLGSGARTGPAGVGARRRLARHRRRDDPAGGRGRALRAAVWDVSTA